VTGVQPGKHGIYDFFRTDTFEKKLVSTRYRKAPAIWNYLTEQGKKCIIVNVPGSYPPEKINGIMISGLLTPSEKSEYTYPSSIKQDLTADNLGTFAFEQIAVDDIPKSLAARYAPQKLVNMVNAATISHATVTMNLLSKYDWDFAMVVFRGTDDVQHLLWGNTDAIFSCYQQADASLGIIMERFPEATIIVVSDHGFAAPKKYVYINNVLYNAGYVRPFSDPYRHVSILGMKLFEWLSRLVFHLIPLEKLVRTPLGQKLILSSGGTANIDFSNSQAVYHSICSCGIRINRNHESGDVLTNEEYEHLRNDLIRLLTELTDPDTGKNIIKKIYTTKEAYGDHAVNDPLDLILEMEDGYSTQELLKPLDGPAPPPREGKKQLAYLTSPGFYDWIGDHHPDGIAFISGTGIQSNQKIAASVTDIVPTVLALLDVPLPDFLDGTVMNKAFSQVPHIKKVHWAPQEHTPSPLSVGEQKKIRELRLKI